MGSWIPTVILNCWPVLPIFYKPKGPTPAVSTSLSPRYSFEQAVEISGHVLQQPSIIAEELRRLRLCGPSRLIFYSKIEVRSKVRATGVAHIISQSLSGKIEGTTEAVQAKFAWAKTAGAIIERFGGFSAHDILGDNMIDSPLDAFTATTSPREPFDKLELLLMPATGQQGNVIPYTYNVKFILGGEYLSRYGGIKPQITFREVVVDQKSIFPPHPRLISLHAACAEMAHMSGAAEVLMEVFRDIDIISVVTEPNAMMS